jgi:hypothetical protein
LASEDGYDKKVIAVVSLTMKSEIKIKHFLAIFESHQIDLGYNYCLLIKKMYNCTGPSAA